MSIRTVTVLRSLIFPIGQLLFIPPLHAEQPSFDRYTVDDGLSQNTVLVSFQDSRGFIWFGTQDGLNRFDGTEFKVYRHDPDDSLSLSENWIWGIHEDRSGFLWIGTFGGGACRYDPSLDRFTSFRHDPNDRGSISDNTVWSFHESVDGVLWVGANNGLNRFDPTTGRFRYFKPLTDAPNVFRVVGGPEGTLWLSTGAGPTIFNVQAESFEPLEFPGEGEAVLSSGVEWSWLTFPPGGVTRHDADGRSTGYRLRATGSLGAIPSPEQISSVLEDRTGLVWLGTRREGIVTLNLSDTTIQSTERISNNPFDLQSLSHNSVMSMFQSPAGQIWIGTREGLNKFDPGGRKFHLLRSLPDSPGGLSHNNVLPIAESMDAGKVWIGTYDGLSLYDRTTGRVDIYRQNSRGPNGPAGNHILALLEESNRDLWVGTRGKGLSRKRVGHGFVHYTVSDEKGGQSSTNTVQVLYQDRARVIWAGTGGDGLQFFDRVGGTLRRATLIPRRGGDVMDQFVFSILEDTAGRFWAGTANGGLCLVDRKAGMFTSYRHDPHNGGSLSSNRVLCAMQTGSGEVWIGTASGLNRLVEGADPSFRSYRQRDGLPSDVIYGILEDESGFLWISTNKGIARVEVRGDSIRVRSYVPEDGLQGNEFNQNSFHLGRSGTLYFGGTNGLNIFHPDEITDNPHVPPIVFTDFKIFNESVRVQGAPGTDDDDLFVLDHLITATEEIVLSYRENVFSFDFASLDYSVPQRNQYAYRMEGFDEGWIYCGTRNSATYTNLDPGEYVFRVKGSNNDGIWNEQGAWIRIRITPPPWRSWWAYLLYGVMFVAALSAFVRRRVRAKAREIQTRSDIERAKAGERERVRRKSSADFHDEAGHLLAKTNLFLELAKRRAREDAELHDYLERVEENTKLLSSGMRDFLWGLDPEKDSLSDTIARIRDFGNQMFQRSTITFDPGGSSAPYEGVPLPMDVRRSVILIFKEAMTNCLKYSGASKVSLGARIKDGMLTLTLSDNGVGFAVREDGAGYGLKNMATRAARIGGSLSIMSDIGQGAEVRLTLPVNHQGQDPTKRADNTPNG